MYNICCSLKIGNASHLKHLCTDMYDFTLPDVAFYQTWVCAVHHAHAYCGSLRVEQSNTPIRIVEINQNHT